MLNFRTLVALFTVLFSANAHAEYPWQPEFEKYLDGLMAEYHVPSVAIAVVTPEGRKLTITRGQLSEKNPKPVDEHTLYCIGSDTKAFTGYLIANLVTQNKLSLTAPVNSYFPEFRVKDEATTKMLSIQDLMGHWTGITRHDLAWVGRQPMNEKDFFGAVAELPQTFVAHKEFHYNNWMWGVTGLVAAKLSHDSWQNLIQSKILDPLAMNETKAILLHPEREENISAARESDGKITKDVPYHGDLGPFSPAGSIFSNLHDLSFWIGAQINQGSVSSTQHLSESAIALSQTAYTPMGNNLTYAMGWMRAPVAADEWIYTHDGGITGFNANVSFSATQKVGVSVLLNSTPVIAQNLALVIWTYLLKKPFQDYVRNRMQAISHAQTYPDLTIPNATIDLHAKAGSFCNALYGNAKMTTSSGITLTAKLNAITLALQAVNSSTLIQNGLDESWKKITFQGNDEFDWQLDPEDPIPAQFTRCAR